MSLRPAYVVALLAATFAVAVPAAAVQTETFGLQASGSRTTIVHPAGDGVVHDSVVVFNRTGSDIAVDLDVIEELRKPDGNYTDGPADAGLAARVALSTRHVELGPHQRRTVGLTIDPPGHVGRPLYAAVTAQLAPPDASNVLSLAERLAVLVGVTAGGNGGGTALHDAVTSPWWWIALVLVLLLLAGLGVTARRRGGLSFRHATRP